MSPLIEEKACVFLGSGASPERSRAFEHGHAQPLARKKRSRGQSAQSAAHDGDVA